jgi:hypothetical protein
MFERSSVSGGDSDVRCRTSQDNEISTPPHENVSTDETKPFTPLEHTYFMIKLEKLAQYIPYYQAMLQIFQEHTYITPFLT